MNNTKRFQLIFFNINSAVVFLSFTDILSPFTYMYYDLNTLGCFKDSQARAIPSLEGQDPVLDGDYTTRQDAARKCALAATKRGHKVYVVMSDGQCSSGADTAKSFAQFGHGKTECSAMGANNKVYNFDSESVDGMIDGFILNESE